MNTQKYTNDLLETGLTQKQLALMLGCSQGLVNAYSTGKKGKRPSYDMANKLISLHKKLCGKPKPSTKNEPRIEIP